jgi:hypothetical protein
MALRPDLAIGLPFRSVARGPVSAAGGAIAGFRPQPPGRPGRLTVDAGMCPVTHEKSHHTADKQLGSMK